MHKWKKKRHYIETKQTYETFDHDPIEEAEKIKKDYFIGPSYSFQSGRAYYVPFEDRVNDHLRKTFKTLTNFTAPYFMKWSTAQGIKID